MPLRTFQVSSELFWGFRARILVEPPSTHESILSSLRQAMEHFFIEANLLCLAERCRKCKFHLHDDVETMLQDEMSEETVFYACDHEHEH